MIIQQYYVHEIISRNNRFVFDGSLTCQMFPIVSRREIQLLIQDQELFQLGLFNQSNFGPQSVEVGLIRYQILLRVSPTVEITENFEHRFKSIVRMENCRISSYPNPLVRFQSLADIFPKTKVPANIKGMQFVA